LVAKIIRTLAGGVIICTPYLAEFVEALKNEIPKEYRAWNPDSKTWYIEPRYAKLAEMLLHEWFETVEESGSNRESPDWARVLHVQPDAPLEVVEAAYRALSKIYHPDLGGDAEKMRELNEAVKEAREKTKPGSNSGGAGRQQRC